MGGGTYALLTPVPVQADHRSGDRHQSGRLPPECLVGLRRNAWSASTGMPGRLAPEYALPIALLKKRTQIGILDGGKELGRLDAGTSTATAIRSGSSPGSCSMARAPGPIDSAGSSSRIVAWLVIPRTAVTRARPRRAAPSGVLVPGSRWPTSSPATGGGSPAAEHKAIAAALPHRHEAHRFELIQAEEEAIAGPLELRMLIRELLRDL